jgi:cell wall associated hydrolase
MNKREKIVQTAKMLKGKEVTYKLGAKAIPPSIPKSLDCSGFVRYCYLSAGVNIPDGTYHQFENSIPINRENLLPGDIGIMENPSNLGKRTNHIGIYLGLGYWIHCNYSRNGITIEKTDIFKYARRFKELGEKGKKDGRVGKMVNVKINGKTVKLDGFEEKDTNYVSIREITELLGKTVEWNEKEKAVVIK